MSDQADRRDYERELRDLLAGDDPATADARAQAGDAIVLLAALEAGDEAEACWRDAADRQILTFSHSCARGMVGAAAALCARTGAGAILSVDPLIPDAGPDTTLFSPRPHDMLVSLPKERLVELDALAARHGVAAICLGMVGGDRLLVGDATRTLLEVPVASLMSMRSQEGT